MMPMHIYDNEELYRSVRDGEYTTRDGRVTFSASAFNDRERKPSVDTSSIRSDPRAARKSASDGVAKLVAGEVRRISAIPIYDAKGKQTGEHEVDVLHRPIENIEGELDNLAHCQVECHPTMESDSRFRKLKEALAGLANRYGFIVEPGAA